MARKRNRNRPTRPVAPAPVENTMDGEGKSKRANRKTASMDDSKKLGCIHTGDDVVLQPFEQDGETVLEVECGPNKAVLYVSKLRQGSKGSCVSFQGSWLTPNEFQFVSGRETAKDWKRSIRHCGKSLKLLLSRGLFDSYNCDIQSGKSGKDGSPSKNSNSNPSDENVSPTKTLQAKFKIRKRRKQKKGKRGKDLGQTTEEQSQDPLGQLELQDENTTEYTASESVEMAEEKATTENAADDKSDDVISEKGDENEGEPFMSDSVSSPTKKNAEADETSARPDPVTSPVPKEKKMEPQTPETPEILTTLGLSAKIRPIESPKPCSELPVIEKLQDTTAEVVNTSSAMDDIECPEPEMPTLLKEGEISGPEVPLPGSVTPFHAAVTPPPTPPSTSPIMADIKKDIPVESRALTLDTHLKLSIERSLSEVDKPVSEQTTDEPTLLLQDFLVSAKRNREQLHKKMALKKQSSETKPSPSLREPATTDMHSRTKPSPYLFDHHMNLKPETFVLKNSSPKHSQKPLQKPNGIKQAPASNHTTHSSSESHKKHSFSPMTSPTDRHSQISSDYLKAISTSLGPMLSHMDSGQLARYSAMFPGLPGLPYKDLKMMTSSGLSKQDRSSLYPFPIVPPTLPLGFPNPMVNMYPYAPMFMNGLDSKVRDSPKETPRESSGDKSRSSTSSSKKKRRLSTEETALDLSVKKPKNEKSSRESYDSEAPLDFSMKSRPSQVLSHSISSESFKRTDNRLSSSFLYHRHSSKRADRHSTGNMAGSIWLDNANVKPLMRNDRCTCSRQSDDIRSWSVDQVCQFLAVLEGCAQYVKTFRDQRISGRLLPDLSTQHLTRTLGMKVGPALTLMQAVDRKLREGKGSLPCQYCTLRPAVPVQM